MHEHILSVHELLKTLIPLQASQMKSLSVVESVSKYTQFTMGSGLLRLFITHVNVYCFSTGGWWYYCALSFVPMPDVTLVLRYILSVQNVFNVINLHLSWSSSCFINVTHFSVSSCTDLVIFNSYKISHSLFRIFLDLFTTWCNTYSVNDVIISKSV